jgi:hypothetical protein
MLAGSGSSATPCIATMFVEGCRAKAFHGVHDPSVDMIQVPRALFERLTETLCSLAYMDNVERRAHPWRRLTTSAPVPSISPSRGILFARTEEGRRPYDSRKDGVSLAGHHCLWRRTVSWLTKACVGILTNLRPRLVPRSAINEFISICGRSSRGSSTWRTRSSTSVGCGSTMSIAVSSAVAASKTTAPLWKVGVRDRERELCCAL